MTAWIVLAALVLLFTLAVRHQPHREPVPPDGYERERQRAELWALR